MRVQARPVDDAECPEDIKPWAKADQTFVTVGRHYDVHAIAVFAHVPLVLIVDDLGYPSWDPGWLFEVRDPTPPADWVCNLFHSELSLVCGPAFLAKDEDAYNRMVELDAGQVRRFWERVDALGEKVSQP